MEQPKGRWGNRLKLKVRSRVLKRQAKRAESATVRHAHRFLVHRWDKIREIRLHVLGWLAGVGVLIGFVGLQMIWFQQSYVTMAPVNGGTFAEAVKGPIQSLNPLYATTPAEHSISRLIFSSLYDYDRTGHLRRDIATSIENKSDQEFTVHLRRDARWHDGEPLTAKDVVFTISLMRNTAARSVMASTWQGVAVEFVDDFTVRFLLPASYAAFPQALTFAILPYHLLQPVDPAALREDTFSSKPVGSGPFSFQLLQTVGQSVDRKIAYLNANEDYYGNRPRLERMQIHTYAEDDKLLNALRTGEVNAASDASSDVVRQLDTSKYKVVTRPVNSGVYALFNTNGPVFKDKNTRKALLMATNTDDIRSKIYGNPEPLHTPFIPSQVANSHTIGAPTYNIDQASKMLDKAGWKLQNGVRKKGNAEMQIRIVTRRNIEFEIALRSLVEQWAKLGIKVDAEVFDTSDATKSFASEILQPRNYDVLLDELKIGGDPDVFAYWHSKGILNFTGYSNESSDDALSGARERSNTALRSAKYVAFAKQWLDDVPAIGLYRSNFLFVHTASTHGVGTDEIIVDTNNHYSTVSYWTAELGKVYKTP